MNPRGARTDVPERAQSSTGETPSFDPRTGRRRRIREDARDGLAAAAVSLGGSIALTVALAALLRWLG